MTVDLVFITYDRLEYTRLALASVLADPSDFRLTIWDNASTDGTRDYLRNEVSDSRIADIVLSAENVGQIEAVNRVWSASRADLVGKLDNDCLMSPGWTETLAQAHADIDQLGVVACWHFYPEDFDEPRARHKIQDFGSHRIFRHPSTCGTGLLIKTDTYRKMGPMTGRFTTAYWFNMANHGYVNGFYYPLVYQEHMDDTRSKHCLLPKRFFDETYRARTGLPAERLTSMHNHAMYHEKVLRSLVRHQAILNNLLDEPFDPAYYSRWRKRARAAGRMLRCSPR